MIFRKGVTSLGNEGIQISALPITSQELIKRHAVTQQKDGCCVFRVDGNKVDLITDNRTNLPILISATGFLYKETNTNGLCLMHGGLVIRTGYGCIAILGHNNKARLPGNILVDSVNITSRIVTQGAKEVIVLSDDGRKIVPIFFMASDNKTRLVDKLSYYTFTRPPIVHHWVIWDIRECGEVRVKLQPHNKSTLATIGLDGRIIGLFDRKSGISVKADLLDKTLLQTPYENQLPVLLLLKRLSL